MQSADETVEASVWHQRCAALRSAGATMLDFLTGVDDPEAGRIEVIVHLVDVPARSRTLLHTSVDRDAPELDTIADLFPGAAWHERETHELFGVRFRGHPDLRPLLTTPTLPLDPPSPPTIWDRIDASGPIRSQVPEEGERSTPSYPLRRTTPLPVRVQTPWPGAKDPTDRPPAQDAGAPAGRVAARPRTRLAPPGIPCEWAQAGAPAPEPEARP